MKKYYEAYDERYKTIHEKGYGWFSDERTPIVEETAAKYVPSKCVPVLEIGCGEGRDAIPLLRLGYDVTATDVSAEAIEYCKNRYPEYAECFRTLDCLGGTDPKRYGFIYSVAVVHMLLTDEDRAGFYRFIKEHLSPGGAALICSMGDGTSEKSTDAADAFTMFERDHPSGKIKVAGTSLRTVSFESFEKEITENGLTTVEKGMTNGAPDFPFLMYAIVK